jgi:hypothetical protein
MEFCATLITNIARRLVCMGALLTLLAVGIDPSVQQTISIRTRMVQTIYEATVPRARYWMDFHDDGDEEASPTIKTLFALYAGLFSTPPNLVQTSQMSYHLALLGTVTSQYSNPWPFATAAKRLPIPSRRIVL